MRRCFIPRQWRFPSLIWGLLILELPFTIANLALFGIASPNLYRTILWAEGGRLGLNSDPTTVLYAAANYRPVKIPIVWSNFNTEYNLVIGVVCMFFYLTKCTGWFLHVLWPIFSLPLHAALLALWAVSIYVQTAPDTIDSDRTNTGPPWYIMKSCGLASSETIEKYCMQAKASFAVSVIMLAIYTFHVFLALFSLFSPTPSARTAHSEKIAHKQAQKEKWAHLAASPADAEMTAEQQWQHMWELQQLPRTPGAGGGMKSPMTPRTQAFGQLDGTRTSSGPTHGWYALQQNAHAGYDPQDALQQNGHAGYDQQDALQQNGHAGYNQQHASYQSQPQNGALGLGVSHGDVSPVHEVDEYVPPGRGSAY